MVENLHADPLVSMVDRRREDVDDGRVMWASPARRLMSAVCVLGLVVAALLAGKVQVPPGGDTWTDGTAGVALWLIVGLVPVVAAGVLSAAHRRVQGSLALATAACVVVATVVGEAMRMTDPPIDRRLLGAIGAGLDVAAVVLVVGALGTLLAPRLARRVDVIALAAGVASAVLLGMFVSPTADPRSLPAVSPLQLPSLSFFANEGEAVLLALALGPLVAAGLVVWALLHATAEARRRMRWLALTLVTGVGIVAVAQLVRLLGFIEVDDGFLAALPRAVAWAAAMCGVAAVIVQPDRGDAAVAVRHVAVGIGLVSILGAAGGVAWFAADATTAPILPGAPAAAAVLTIAALFLPVRDRLERTADRWLFGEVGSDARLIDAFGEAVEHAGRFEVLELLVTTARKVLRLRWSRASTGPIVAVAGIGADDLPVPVASFALMESGEQLGVLECGPKRGGPLGARDRQLLGALGREAALRLRTVSQADELEVRLHQIEAQAAEIAASRARIVEAQDEERRRLERDIHDGVQQELASLIGKLRLARTQLDQSTVEAAATIASAQDDVRRTLADVRSIAQGIHPAILDDRGVALAIEARAKRLPLEVTVETAPALVGRRFDRSIEGAAYFVASEALANVVKHADATAVAVHLGLDGDLLVIRVEDDGRGLGDHVVRGSGLTNMADRAAALGGQVTVDANATGGTLVIVELPLTPTLAV
jgi:signal transduction histidine kinase